MSVISVGNIGLPLFHNMTFSLWMLVALLVLLAGPGCGKKPDVKENLSGLQKAFPAAAVSAQAEPTPAAAPRVTDPNAYVSLALSAARTNDYAGGVIALQ